MDGVRDGRTVGLTKWQLHALSSGSINIKELKMLKLK